MGTNPGRSGIDPADRAAIKRAYESAVAQGKTQPAIKPLARARHISKETVKKVLRDLQSGTQEQ